MLWMFDGKINGRGGKHSLGEKVEVGRGCSPSIYYLQEGGKDISKVKGGMWELLVILKKGGKGRKGE